MTCERDRGYSLIRIADLGRLIPLAREFYSKSRFLRNLDPDRFTRMWAELIERGAGEIFLLPDDGSGPITGALGAVTYAEPYSGELIATEFFWYVADGFRGQGMNLYRAFEEWARNRKCSQIRMVHLMDSMPDKLNVVYRRLGYEPAELHYVKEL